MASGASPLVWLVTGTSSGIGREIALEALNRGDNVIATARAKSFSQLGDLKAAGADTMELDVTSSPQQIEAFAKSAVTIYGHVDVLVNNAGTQTSCGHS
jgi:NAD(P)-dependent dehydrogenase (short-subunit alcohol dehydrogenase family)